MLNAKQILSVLLPVLLFFVSACTQQTGQTGFNHKSGIRFDFPEEWSMLSKKEWRAMDLGKDKTLVTITDKDREAGFSLIPVGFDSELNYFTNIKTKIWRKNEKENKYNNFNYIYAFIFV